MACAYELCIEDGVDLEHRSGNLRDWCNSLLHLGSSLLALRSSDLFLIHHSIALASMHRQAVKILTVWHRLTIFLCHRFRVIVVIVLCVMANNFWLNFGTHVSMRSHSSRDYFEQSFTLKIWLGGEIMLQRQSNHHNFSIHDIRRWWSIPEKT